MNATPPNTFIQYPNSVSNAQQNTTPHPFATTASIPFNHSPIALSEKRIDDLFTKVPIPCGSATKRKKRKIWSKHEDRLLSELVKQAGDSRPNWNQLARKLEENLYSTRTGKQCRERWQNHLRSNIKKGNWSLEEENLIRTMHHTFGPKWSCMSKLIKHRTDNDIKNKWNSMERTRKAHEARYGISRQIRSPTISGTAKSTSNPVSEAHATRKSPLGAIADPSLETRATRG